MVEGAKRVSDIRPITADDIPALLDFVRKLPERDRTFLKEEIGEETVRGWCSAQDGSRRWVCVDTSVEGILAIIPGTGWSSHVGELRLVVDAAHRGQGIGPRLARHGLLEALSLGLEKIFVEVVARESDVAIFTRIGFRPEALLEGHIRDREGRRHDLVIMAHQVGEQSGAMNAVGLDQAVASHQGDM
jgi:ribosomal protein S18 acetylase RimI-like enzyme